MSSDIDERRSRRALRRRIARLRRRIDRRAHALGREGRRLASWQTYVRRYPAPALATAFGIGLAASSGFRVGWSRIFAARMARRAADKVAGGLARELKAIWEDSRPDRRPTDEERGAERGRA